MFLKSLEIQGFKSFPDKTLLTFGPGITAVVGPNGSGKSNISDAIRWVLGEMSAKSLRGSRMEDVIFGGTVLRKAQGFAEVTLTIDNRDRALSFDGDEVSVTRRYFRSGESEYQLNRAEVRLKDIVMLFMDTGLGRDGYSVIGQGRIAEIVGARSEDRREIFEEAAGIAKYRYRKEESEHRLAAAEDNLARLRDILAELEARVGPLKEQAEKAKRYIDLAGEKKTLEVGLWLAALDRQRDALREHDNRLNLARSQYDGVEQKLSEIASGIEEAFMAAQKAAAEAEEHRTQARGLEEAAAGCEAQAAVIDNDMVHNRSTLERLAAELENLRQQKDTGESEAAERRAGLAALEEKKLSLEEELAACEQGLLALSSEGDELGAQIDKAGAELSRLNAEITRLQLEKGSRDAALVHIDGRLAAVDGEKAARLERLQAAREAARAAVQRQAEVEERAQGLGNSLKGYTMKEASRRDKLRAAEENTRKLTLAAAEKNQKANMLAELERHMEGFSHSVKAIMKERERGLLRGIHGPVSRLLHVDAKYTVAVETALGAGAQNIVVAAEEDAKAAITFLKNTDGGRATFLPLTSVRGGVLTQRGLADCDGYVGLAHELTQYDAKFDAAVKSLLGRTAVAEDLDAAVAMARKFGYTFRIVTLDGQLVNAGGSMTGGSASRSAGLLSRAGEIESLRAEAERLGRQLAGAETEKKAAQAELSALQAEISGLKGELQTAQEDLIRVGAERQRAQEQAQSLDADIRALETEEAESLSKKDALGEESARAQQLLAALGEQAAAAQAELERLGVGRGDLAARREEQAEHLTGLRLALLACGKDIDAARAAIAEQERLQADREGAEQRLTGEITDLEQKNEQARGEGGALRGKAASLRAEAAEMLSLAEKSGGRRQEIERGSADLRAAERGLSEDKEKISRELARLEERRVTAQAEYDGLISRLWEEYELTRSEAEKITGRMDDPAAAQRRLSSVKKEIKDLGDVNVGAIEEYKEVSQRYEFLCAQTADVEKSRAELLSLIDELTSKMREIFSARFEEINRHFSHTFVELFGGGAAHLELTDPQSVLSSGIEIVVQPPGKIIKSLTALSGGEQAFVAIALYFAILKVRPSPFCVLDEIEAALDDANVSRFAAYLRRMCDNTQFIVITHRRGTMDEADVLYGVTMQDEGVSKLLTLNVAELMQKLGVKA